MGSVFIQTYILVLQDCWGMLQRCFNFSDKMLLIFITMEVNSALCQDQSYMLGLKISFCNNTFLATLFDYEVYNMGEIFNTPQSHLLQS